MKDAYSVREVNQYIKNMFDQDFFLNNISVEGEVSNCKYHSSGHIYFSLKDSGGTLSCIMFASQARSLTMRLTEGLKVVVKGSVSVYPRDGKYSLYVNRIRRQGQGELYLKFLKLKEELEEMGMFAPEYKKPLPVYPKVIGVVTALTGAAIRDIESITARRNPFVQLILFPAKVQGEGAAESIARGIRTVARLNPDVIIVGRGGGSIEDLWAFNEEVVARAIFECPIPIVSAVGHETDVTISDYVADVRAATPSAAAEICVYEFDKLKEKFSDTERSLDKRMRNTLLEFRERVLKAERRLILLNPLNSLRERREYLMRSEERWENLMRTRITAGRHRLEVLTEKLEGLSPSRRLESGYAYVESEDHRHLSSAKEAEVGDMLKIYFKDGRILAQVKED
ncbi:MAG: exodeoxyribonuclease VII large subunit [Clostridiales bacterium]|nr:exodeoxyribonuclease VII large subunit [Clostridiales bacterium]